jgi:hypothetical protein
VSTFPQVIRDIVVELFVNSTWVDISSDVYYRDKVVISRGRKDEATQYQPATCKFTINNRSGNYSPRWPTGSYYGTLGRNTPVRVSVRLAKDTFTRTVSSGWGSADTGQAWTVGGAGGSVLASDHNVAAGVGTQSVPAVSAYRYGVLTTAVYLDVDVQVDVSLSFTSVTGGNLEPANIMLRWQSTTVFYLVRLTIAPGGNIQISLIYADGTVIAAAVNTGLTHASSQTIRVRAQCVGNTLKAKAWAATGNEPYGWQVSAHTTTVTTSGAVGVRSGVATGNSNTLPIVFSYDNFQLKVLRFSGEISSWPQEWDVSGKDIFVKVGAAGLLQRLVQGTALLQSALRRSFQRDTHHMGTPVVYWPCEDGMNSLFMASGLGGDPLRVLAGVSTFAASTIGPASDPIPKMGTGTWGAIIPAYAQVNGRCALRFLLNVPSAGSGAFPRTIATIVTNGNLGIIRLQVDGNLTGNLELLVYQPDSSLWYDSTVIPCGLNGFSNLISVEFQQVGADVKVNFYAMPQGVTSPITIPGGDHTITGKTIGIANYVVINEFAQVDGNVGVGHVHFITNPDVYPLSLWANDLVAYNGEVSGTRLNRICGEEMVPFAYEGDLTDTTLMGPQTSQTLVSAINECAASDLGPLFESRHELGLSYRTRTSLYNQVIGLTLNYASHVVAPPFQPTDDDQLTRNDITVSRSGGASARAQLLTGRLSVLDPSAGGVGRYPDSRTISIYLDSLLADVAGWILHTRTVDESRYPAVTVDLANPDTVTAAIEPSVLAIDIGDRFVITNPKSGQTADTISQIVIGIDETLDNYTHVVAFNTSPESPYQTNYLDDSVSSYNSTDSTLSAGVSSGATSLSIATTSGTLWTTVGGDFPFNVIMAGEVMTVSNITGSSSPQTFTVTRSVNGVVKAQLINASVQLQRAGTFPL